ncbi:FadR/GntR family transcriptional regulator [Ruania rhizosphaerae]|uniref:FadR/GntR family transcriptional regulator n=1 Tax=Ruania rhizosphaerae TaxID=1840413 RepID=UPI001357FEA3|nr:FadR/GntR family transcriptional regulator [Ruania rhizosphaerae]
MEKNTKKAGASNKGSRAQTYRPGYEIAAERILALIDREGHAPGDRLPTEKDLASRLEVSHTVAREAIKLLSARGQVVTRKGAGIFVANPTTTLTPGTWEPLLLQNLDHVEMLYEARRTLEVEAAAQAAKRSNPSELKQIRDAAQATVDAAAEGAFDAYIAADEQLHLAIAQGSHNMFFCSLIENLSALKRRVMTVGFEGEAGDVIRRGAGEHARIAAAISDGDADEAGAAMGHHVDMALDQYRQQVQKRLLHEPREPIGE